MKKKMYKQPQTDVAAVNTERMMDGITMSTGGDKGPGVGEAPARRGDIID